MKQDGHCREAIVHFAASQQLAPSPKALLNLADCEMRLDDLVGARAHAEQGRDLARQRQDAELTAIGESQLAAVEARLPKLTITQAPPAPAGPRQGAPRAAPTDGSSASDAGAASGLGTRRIVALALGGAGLAGIAVGSIFGVQAISKNGESNSNGQCDSTGCDSAGTSLRNDALHAATASTVAFAVGVAALAGATILYFTGNPEVQVAASVGPSYGGLDLRTTW